MKEQQQVKQFMRAVGQETPDKPTMGSDADMILRQALIFEELEEYRCAKDIVDVADAIGDLLYVVLGAAVAHGLDLDPIFQEIHRSNMSKVDNGHKGESGKWIKGPNYSPAYLQPIVFAQGGGL